MKKKKWLFAALAVLLLCAVVLLSEPRVRVRAFLLLHESALEKVVEDGRGRAVIVSNEVFHTWDGEHTMVESTLFVRGDTYYGCYYSVDDVPLAFQNTAAELVQTGENAWKWEAEGDNSGVTERIGEGWYYFEASF